MTPDTFRNALVLTGPTGSGKSALAVELAERLGAEVVSMDSMALYRGMDVGTAKPDADQRRRVPHHLIDVLDPWESASVAWWLARAAECVREIEGRGRRALVVGGTPLYLKALLHGLFDGPPADPELRQRLTEEAERLGGAALHARLAVVDPASAARLHPNDVRRVVRALEVWQLTGRPLSAWQTQWSIPVLSTQYSVLGTPRVLCLDVPRDELYARIDARVVQMFGAGLLDEAAALRRLPRPLSREAAKAVGYAEAFACLDGRATRDQTIRLVQTRSRQLAKRQLTWFRQMPACRPATRELTFGLWGSTMGN
ncbi:MAG TPA: tRNA (adenosine(37)-N6)-dimethylallyltransferase MiaA [Gemmataceae bacterium]|nr:tRNA (adenosine(37)-N6)-dimethylallyltransferase MiaA [Gemmataceae bacterium]